MKNYWMYILASQRNGTLYVGVTNDIGRRMYEHKAGIFEGFTKKYKIHHLVYAEEFQNIGDAIHREKCIKKWNRAWKLNLIEQLNPQWKDLSDTFF